MKSKKPPAAKNPFEKGFLDLPKLFNWDGLDTVFHFVSLRVTSWLKLDGGFWTAEALVLNFEIWLFEFVSDFDIRISDLKCFIYKPTPKRQAFYS